MSQGQDVDTLIDGFVEGLSPEATALALATLVHRGVTRLHTLSRAQASVRKDQPDWPGWAQLQNASRALVLQASTCRDLAAKLVGGRT
jgi:hypothetical protein